MLRHPVFCFQHITLMLLCRGILSMSWCPSDPDLLLSSGKDNRILCWNPNSEFKMGEVSLVVFDLLRSCVSSWYSVMFESLLPL